jgi:RNase P subunit RPR2
MNILNIKEFECPSCRTIQQPKFQGKMDVEEDGKTKEVTVWVCSNCKTMGTIELKNSDEVGGMLVGDEEERRRIGDDEKILSSDVLE